MGSRGHIMLPYTDMRAFASGNNLYLNAQKSISFSNSCFPVVKTRSKICSKYITTAIYFTEDMDEKLQAA